MQRQNPELTELTWFQAIISVVKQKLHTSRYLYGFICEKNSDL